MASINPAKFVREVRQEIGRVTWPTRKETTVSSVMVLIFVALASVFFLLVDWVSSSLVSLLIGVA